MTENSEAKFLTTKDLADRWGVSKGTVDQWRYVGRGPRYYMFGGNVKGAVRYSLDDVEEYERRQIVEPKRGRFKVAVDNT